MYLSQPLSSISPSLDADVLTVLTRTNAPLTGRGIVSLARRGSQQGIQAILDRLVDEGLVDAQPAGKAVLYTLNYDHLLAELLVAIASTRETLLDRIRAGVSSWPIPALHVSLFGSMARGEAGPGSDIDLLVVRGEDVNADGAGWAVQLVELEERVRRWTGNPLSWFEITQAGLAAAVRDGEPVVESWRADSVHLAGTRLAQLLPAAVR